MTRAQDFPGRENDAAGTHDAARPRARFDAPRGPQTRPYGRILIFTLLEDRVAEFDRLAEHAAERVRTGEPDTLVYVIHLVPNAPLQRIFYEIYRDRAAFDSHENQLYMQRFVADRRACVLATNSIELRLKYAKVAPLPAPQPAAPPQQPGGPYGPPGPRAQRPPRPQPAPKQPMPTQPMPPQPLTPLPPQPRGQRPDPRYGGS